MIAKNGMKLNGKNGFFYLDIDGVTGAKMTFYFSDEKTIVIDHAEVDEAFNGLGYGKKMVADAVQYARKKELKIIPVCPFVKKVLERNPEYSDVLK